MYTYAHNLRNAALCDLPRTVASSVFFFNGETQARLDADAKEKYNTWFIIITKKNHL